MEVREVAAEELETVKLTNVVPPIHFAVGVAEIPDATVVELRRILESMRDRRNVRLHLVGHADNQPLVPALAAVFGDNEGLSRERARRGRRALEGHASAARRRGLPTSGRAIEARGVERDGSRPRAEPPRRGRGLVRRGQAGHGARRGARQRGFQRIKVCRTGSLSAALHRRQRAAHARAERRGARALREEAVEVTPIYVEQIREAVAGLSDRHNVLVKFIGYTDDAPLSERNARIYGDQTGLSRAQARRVALAVQEELGLATSAVDSDGRGSSRPLGSNATAQGAR
jgi:flagellar motor protein MotB